MLHPDYPYQQAVVHVCECVCVVCVFALVLVLKFCTALNACVRGHLLYPTWLDLFTSMGRCMQQGCCSVGHAEHLLSHQQLGNACLLLPT